MNNFVMLVGLPASGKSTQAQLYKSQGYAVFSSDEYREKLLGDVGNQANNNQVFETMHKDIEDCMKQGLDVVYDACNISAKRRKSYLESIKKYGYATGCDVMATPYEECLRRNAQRDRKVPEEAIKRMYMNFYVPWYNEGWDAIQVLYSEPETYEYLSIVDFFANDMSQDNPHHTMTLIEHCLRCANLASEDDEKELLWYAGALHDCGKPFTKVFHNIKNEPTDIAHYYNHQNVGGYLSLFYLHNSFLLKEDSILYIANLIQYHMQPYFVETEKARNKFKALVGEDMYEDIMILHEADKNAH